MEFTIAQIKKEKNRLAGLSGLAVKGWLNLPECDNK
jgi:hypothetical protein